MSRFRSLLRRPRQPRIQTLILPAQAITSQKRICRKPTNFKNLAKMALNKRLQLVKAKATSFYRKKPTSF